ncbi:hypothetical protein MMC24_001441 [Lignoscripta atroalba]|nr:hypothetical protein [Lignoscripta atroalba]
MSAFGTPTTVKVGYKFVNKGGLIYKKDKPEFGVFDVLQCTVKGQEDRYLVTLRTEGETAPEYSVGDPVTYNSKGTNNHNADTTLKVFQVIGPFQFLCTGPQLLNG